jgi:hypothetical protein
MYSPESASYWTGRNEGFETSARLEASQKFGANARRVHGDTDLLVANRSPG